MSSSDVSAVTNYFATPNEGFTTTLGSTIAIAAVTVPLNSVTGLTNGAVFVGIIEPGLTNQQVFTGVVDTGGSQITGVKWTRGTNVGHATGVTIVDYVTGTAFKMATTGILKEHKQSGAHSAITADTAVVGNLEVTGTLTIDGNTGSAGWSPISGNASVSTGFNKGNREFAITTDNDQTAVITPGMRFKVTRNTTPPTQAMAFASASSQYGSKSSPSGISFTGVFSCEAWIYITAYTGQPMTIINRQNQTNATGGWCFRIDPTGGVNIFYGTGANFTNFISNQSVPIGRWVHVAGVITSIGSKTGIIYIDGVACPTSSSVVAATTLTQDTVDLRVGAASATPSNTYFNGYMSEVRVWSATRTATQIQDNMSTNAAGNESNLVALYKGNGVFTDGTANANTLTQSGGAIATQAANPYNTTEYGIVTKVTSTVVTVFTGTTCSIPNMTLNTPSFASVKTPFGWPTADTWYTDCIFLSAILTKGGATNGTWYNGGVQISVPTGAWELGYEGFMLLQSGGTTNLTGQSTLSTGTSTNVDSRFQDAIGNFSASFSQLSGHLAKRNPVAVTAQTIYYANQSSTSGSGTINFYWYVDSTSGAPLVIRAVSAYA